VRFPDHSRTLTSTYSTILSGQFDTVVRRVIESMGWELRLNTRAIEVRSDRVTLESGEELKGQCVIDASGPRQAVAHCGYQKFLGLEVETEDCWPDLFPVVMDATVSQSDGFHFIYTLPLSANRVLVEDTCFSDTPALDKVAARSSVCAYLEDRVGVRHVVREESGVLPMPWTPDPRVFQGGPLLGGYAGAWYHPATGYSLPGAVRFALAVAAVPPGEARRAVAALSRRLAPRQSFARFLNRLLFRFVPPDCRWQVFSRLYRTLPTAVLARFYALEFTTADAVRLIFGRPPRIDLTRALAGHQGNPSWLSLQP
jgi:lycopene beta-cyclase